LRRCAPSPADGVAGPPSTNPESEPPDRFARKTGCFAETKTPVQAARLADEKSRASPTTRGPACSVPPPAAPATITPPARRDSLPRRTPPKRGPTADAELFPALKCDGCRWPGKQRDTPDCACFPPD